jgi:AraC-like DNA-binding protein
MTILFSRYKRWMKSQLSEYFFYFAFVSALIIVILAGTLYFYTSALLKSQTVKANEQTLQQMKNAQEVIISEADKSYAGIVIDSGFIDFGDYYADRESSKNTITLKAIQDKLSGIVLTNEYIDSISIYYHKRDIVLSSDAGVSTLRDYYDGEFLQKVADSTGESSGVISRKKLEYQSKNPAPVISMIKKIPLIYDGQPNAYVIINIRAGYLRKMMDSIDMKSDSNVVITDTLGNILYQRASGDITAKTVGHVFNNKELSVGKEKLSQSFIEQGILASYLQSDKYGWWYFYLVPMSEITRPVRSLLTITLIVCLAVIGISVLIALFLSRRIYNPIHSILNVFAKNEGIREESDDGLNQKETDLIRKNIDTLIDKNKSLEVLLKDYDGYQKNLFLNSLVLGTLDKDGKTEQRLEYYGINFQPGGWFCALVISMDKYQDFINEYSEKQKNMLFIYMSENIMTKMLEKDTGFLTETNANEMVLIVSFPPYKALQEAKDDIDRLAKEIHGLITQNFKYTFTVGVSGIHQNLAGIPICYNEGVAAMNFRLLMGYNNIISYDSVKTGSGNTAVYPYIIENNLLSSLKTCDSEGIFSALDDFTGYIYANSGNDMEFIRHYFIQLLSSSVKCIYDSNRSFEELMGMQKEIYSSILWEETMDGIKVHLAKLYESVLNYANIQKNAKNKDVVTEVKSFIENNLGTDLAIERVAEIFYLSSSHLRKVFKEETGMTIKEYIDDLRIRRAKEMLEDPLIKIGDIAEQVGYLSAQTFTRAFKLATGQAPGEYRAQYIMSAGRKSDKV